MNDSEMIAASGRLIIGHGFQTQQHLVHDTTGKNQPEGVIF